MLILLLVCFSFFALVALCPGPPAPAVKLEGCRCRHCQWYVNRRESCADQATHRLGYIFPKWSFASPVEMVEFAEQNGLTETLIQRSLTYLQAEVDREILWSIHHIKPITSSGSIHYYKPERAPCSKSNPGMSSVRVVSSGGSTEPYTSSDGPSLLR